MGNAKKKGKRPKSASRDGDPAGRVGPAGVRNDFRHGRFAGPAQGSGTQYITYAQQYAPVPTALAALPPLPPEFTGRDDDLAYLLDAIDPAEVSRPPVAVVAGLPGVGKTTLAHAAGHAAQERGWFTGVLLVNLRGHEPVPAEPGNVLDALLRSLGVQAEHIPPTEAERASLYRSQLDERARAGDRVLVIADNAATAEQVRPLLPPGRHALLVTSRRRLPGLGRLRALDLLRPEDAVALLDTALRNADPDDHRVADDPDAARRVALACDRLPLALQITAAVLAADPTQPLSERADRLTAPGTRLAGLDDGERSVRAAFDQSLDRLPLPQAELFLLLSLNAGPDISTTAASALTGQPEPATEHLLAQLATAHLVQRGAQRGRWGMHDLLRDYADETAQLRAAQARPTRRRHEQARERLVEYYARMAEAADTHIESAGRTPAPLFGNRLEALAWMDGERANLIATAHAEGRTFSAARLAFALGGYLRWRRQLQDLVIMRSLALDACRGDSRNEAAAWSNLGSALREVRRFDEAIAAHETARSFYQQHHDTRSEAMTWNNLGLAFGEMRRFEEAIAAHETARTIHQQQHDTHNEAAVWNNLGVAFREVRRFEEAIAAHETARTLYRQHHDTHGEAMIWNNLGLALQEARRFEEAVAAHETARTLHQQHHDTRSEAMTWNNLGTTYRDQRRFAEAIVAGERAAEMLEAVGDLFLTGKALGELATTLAAAGTATDEVRGVWSRSARAYEDAGAEKEAAESREKAENTAPEAT